ncbi:MAG: FAD-dependent oxidoreductase [Coriobacteriales bacterium]|jgi:NADPH-dependent glutamate synthase beta subunit-like oxidoreductase
MTEKITVTINGKSCEGEAGQTILEIADANGIAIPNLCNNGELEHYGGCSMCVVEAEGSRKLLRACSTVASDGQVIETESDRVVNSRKIALEFLMSDHVGDCCGPCVLECPDNVQAQAYVQAIARGDDLEAVKILKEDLPLPASIGRICPHPCENACRRQMVEEPISISFLKYAAADRVLANGGYVPQKKPSSGKSVGIAGGGPAGLTAAYYLALEGHDVTIIDAQEKMGGMLRYGIPEYRLPKSVLDAEIAEIESLGVHMKNGISLGEDISLSTFRCMYDAVIIAVGAWESLPLRINGEDETSGVFPGIGFLYQVANGEKPEIGNTVLVVGGGNTAMDACRTAVRLGAEKVYVSYRRTENEMPADPVEVEESREEGVEYKFLRNPDSIIADESGHVKSVKLQVMKLGEPDETGRRRPIPVKGEFETIDVDSVIVAIGQKVDVAPFASLELNRRQIIVADEFSYRTSVEDVFAVGDATNRGAGIAIEAIGEAKRCARVVDMFLHGIDMPYRKPYRSVTEKTPEDFKDREKHARVKNPIRPAEERRKDFDPVYLGFSDEQMREEASRCLDCGCFDFKDCELIKCSNLYEIHPERLGDSKHPSYIERKLVAIERDQGKCILCGQCVRMCDEVVGKGIIGLTHRGFVTEIEPAYTGPEIEKVCANCLKCVEACPTGALRAVEEEVEKTRA